MTTVTPGAVEVRQADSGFTPENIADAEWLVANIPGIRRFHDMPTYERAMICHTAARFRTSVLARYRIAATPPDALQTVVEALREARRIIADIDEYMKRPGRGDWGEECACCMGELLDDDRGAIARIDAALSLAGGDV